MELVSLKGLCLQYGSEPLRADRDLVRAAVAQDRRALRFAAEPLRAELSRGAWRKTRPWARGAEEGAHDHGAGAGLQRGRVG